MGISMSFALENVIGLLASDEDLPNDSETRAASKRKGNVVEHLLISAHGCVLPSKFRLRQKSIAFMANIGQSCDAEFDVGLYTMKDRTATNTLQGNANFRLRTATNIHGNFRERINHLRAKLGIDLPTYEQGDMVHDMELTRDDQSPVFVGIYRLPWRANSRVIRPITKTTLSSLLESLPVNATILVSACRNFDTCWPDDGSRSNASVREFERHCVSNCPNTGHDSGIGNYKKIKSDLLFMVMAHCEGTFERDPASSAMAVLIQTFKKKHAGSPILMTFDLLKSRITLSSIGWHIDCEVTTSDSLVNLMMVETFTCSFVRPNKLHFRSKNVLEGLSTWNVTIGVLSRSPGKEAIFGGTESKRARRTTTRIG